MSTETVHEARRQIEICNACRYCEGYCSVFPAINRRRSFPDIDIVQMANLCHNCRGCYYACQYTEPHEFKINIPAVLADIRQDTWQRYATPSALAKLFQKSGVAVALGAVIGLALIIWAIRALGAQGGSGFYAVLSHSAMVLVFTPAFVLPLLTVIASVTRYIRDNASQMPQGQDWVAAVRHASTLRDLSGGHGEGCNFEDEDRFSNARRIHHQLTMYGFLLCFAATSVATLMHYGLDMPAPYPLWSLPKLLGLSGGVLLSAGTAGLAALKLKSDRHLADASVFGGEMAFVLLLFVVSTSGLFLYWWGDTKWLDELLAVHLGAVLAFFILTPYTKMVHGLYRLAALAIDARDKRA
jgi:citrate/tricarballylate utilization protein